MKTFFLNNRYKLWLCLPVITCMLIDLSITSLGQPADYWQGNLNTAIEGNPILSVSMAHSIYGLFLTTLLWCILVSFLILLFPRRVSMVIAFAIVLGNTWGAATWLTISFYESGGFWFAMILFVFNSILTVVGVEKSVVSG